jgi:succinate dehydrogenase flavin-adding protein (antitoxin of CptAB toxin-antitoxin module)
MIESAEAIQIAVAMTDKEILDFCKLTGIRTKDNSIEFVKAQVIKLSNDDPNKFSRIINDRDKDYRVFIEHAIDAKILNFVNGTYKHNTETIGLTEDQVVLWLKDNKDIHALLRKEMSSNKKVKAKK